MNTDTSSFKKTAGKESVIFLWFLVGGLFLLPAAVYLVGNAIFGEYGGTGFSAFYGDIHSELRGGEPAVWFLILSPYIVWQLLRLSVHAFRLGGRG